MPEGRVTQDAVAEGSTPSVGTILHSSAGTPTGKSRYAYMDVGGRALPGASAESTQSSCRERRICNANVGGSSADYAFLLRRPVQVNLPWLPARPDASMLASKHRSRPSLGTIPIADSSLSSEHLSCVGVRASTPSIGTISTPGRRACRLLVPAFGHAEGSTACRFKVRSCGARPHA